MYQKPVLSRSIFQARLSDAITQAEEVHSPGFMALASRWRSCPQHHKRTSCSEPTTPGVICVEAVGPSQTSCNVLMTRQRLSQSAWNGRLKLICE
jgi:hypothetical protein